MVPHGAYAVPDLVLLVDVDEEVLVYKFNVFVGLLLLFAHVLFMCCLYVVVFVVVCSCSSLSMLCLDLFKMDVCITSMKRSLLVICVMYV